MACFSDTLSGPVELPTEIDPRSEYSNYFLMIHIFKVMIPEQENSSLDSTVFILTSLFAYTLVTSGLTYFTNRNSLAYIFQKRFEG